MRALITGAGGILGSALVRSLLAQGVEVEALVRSGPGLLDEASLNHPNLHIIEADLLAPVPVKVARGSLDCVFHLASRQPTTADLTYDDFYHGNVTTTRHAIVLARAAGVPLFVYASTTSVGADDGGEAAAPEQHYGLTKFIAERLVFCELRGTDSKGLVVRFPSLIGRDHRGGLAHTYVELARAGKDIDVFGNGKPLRNLLHVSDAVAALCAAPLRRETLPPFALCSVGSRDALPTLAIATLLRDLLGSASRVVPVDRPGGGDVLVDNTLAERLLGVKPMSMDACLKRYIAELT